MKRTRLFLTFAVLGFVIAGLAAAQVFPVRLDSPEPRFLLPPPTLVVAEGGIEFPDGSIQREAARANPDPPCFDDTHRFVDCGNGTVTDTETGVIWLKDLNCITQTGTYATVNTYVTNFWEGDCAGLSDGSRPGDWRLATSEEWQRVVNPSCPTLPKIRGAEGGAASCHSDDPWAVGLGTDDDFWGSNTSVLDVTRAWAAGSSGGVQDIFKTGTAGYWPVRGDGRPID